MGTQSSVQSPLQKQIFGTGAQKSFLALPKFA